MEGVVAKTSGFEKAAATFDKWAADMERAIKVMPPSCKPAIMREVAHYLECASRLRGRATLLLSLKAQRRAHPIYR